MKPFRKIIWAINPSDSEDQKNMVKTLSELSSVAQATIQPVSVATLSRHFTNYTLKDVESAVTRGIQTFLANHPVPNLVEPKVLAVNETSLRKSVALLDEHATRENADFIAVGTHGRKGVPRLFLGSFAESLLLTSKHPVLVVGPNIKLVRPIQDILFPTDFSAGSRKIFNSVLELAKILVARVTIFHALEPMVTPFLFEQAWMLKEDLPGELEKSYVDEARTWVADAQNRDVRADYKIYQPTTSSSDAIVSFAKERSMDLIAMKTQSGQLEAAIAGSIVRQVVRDAACPVLVMRKGV